MLLRIWKLLKCNSAFEWHLICILDSNRSKGTRSFCNKTVAADRCNKPKQNRLNFHNNIVRIISTFGSLSNDSNSNTVLIRIQFLCFSERIPEYVSHYAIDLPVNMLNKFMRRQAGSGYIVNMTTNLYKMYKKMKSSSTLLQWRYEEDSRLIYMRCHMAYFNSFQVSSNENMLYLFTFYESRFPCCSFSCYSFLIVFIFSAKIIDIVKLSYC